MRFKSLILFLVILLMSACGGSTSDNSYLDRTPSTPTPPPAPVEVTPTLNTLNFMPINNSELSSTINADINDKQAFVRTDSVISMDNLIATFDFSGSQVFVNGVVQQSGVTVNDFSDTVNYTVRNEQGAEVTYAVDVMQFTGLPVIYLTTDHGSDITNRDNYTTGTAKLYGNGLTPDIETMDMEIRGRGNSTWAMPKKPYQMKLSDKREFLGMENDKKWLFLAEYADKTMLRNRTAFELGYLSNLTWTPDARFAEVYINEAYTGTYLISQKVEEGGDRVDLGDDGFLLEIDQPERLDPDDVFFETSSFLVNIKEPSLDKDDEQYNYIRELVNDFESALYSDSFTDPSTGYRSFINVESFIDWYLISEITKNVDSKFFSSIYFHVIPGEKIKMGPLWDFDLSFGNVDYADPEFPTGFWVKDNPWFARMFDDPNFVEQVQERFIFYREQQNYMLEKIDEYAEKLQYAQQENDEVWQTIGIYVWPNPVVLSTYDAEVNRLKNWYITRMDWLENALNDL